jgi:hypothetical protein
MTDDPLASAVAKTEWAHQNIQALEARLVDLRAVGAYQIVTEQDPTSPDVLNKVIRIHEPAATNFLVETSLRAGDAVHSMRGALDHLACAVVPTPTEQTAFPIWRKPRRPTPQQYKSLVRRKVNGASKPVREFLEQLQPYEGGHDEKLWIADYLNIVDKHRLLISTMAQSQGIALNLAAIAGDPRFASASTFAFRFNGPYVPVEDGDIVLANVMPDRPDDVDPYIPVVLGEPAPIAGEPVLVILASLLEAVVAVTEAVRVLA